MQKMSLENEELVLHLANSQDVQEQMRAEAFASEGLDGKDCSALLCLFK